jgi:IS30 family transposase
MICGCFFLRLNSYNKRKTRLRLAAPLSAKRSKETAEAIISLLEPIKEFVKTIPFDNGKEFSPHEKLPG